MKKTIKFKGVDLNVEFYILDGEPEVRHYPDGSGHPKTGNAIEITSIMLGKHDMYEIVEDSIEQIKDLLTENDFSFFDELKEE